MYLKLFVLGRPGSGKTTAAHHIMNIVESRGYTVYRKRDYDILQSMFQKDQENGNTQNFRATAYNGFDVLKFSVLDQALKRLEREVQQVVGKEEGSGVIVIEFARNDYRNAFNVFEPEFLENSYFFFVEADLNTCIRRIHQRVMVPPLLDCHFVSDQIMRSYYNDNQRNWLYMSDQLGREYGLSKGAVRLYYNVGTVERFLEYATDVVENILAHPPFHSSWPVDEPKIGSNLMVANSSL
jgi:adenylate kinase family enzyme